MFRVLGAVGVVWFVGVLLVDVLLWGGVLFVVCVVCGLGMQVFVFWVLWGVRILDCFGFNGYVFGVFTRFCLLSGWRLGLGLGTWYLD